MEEKKHLATENDGKTFPLVEQNGMEVLVMREEEDEDKEAKERGQWSRHLDFILSIVGFCVGLGNLWRFPYLCNRNGGGAFLIPFFIFLLVCGLPLFMMEICIGQFSGKGAIRIWDICPLFRGLGVGMIIISSITTIYYNTILAWCIYYLVRSCAAVLPWTTCGNWWNTEHCIVRVGPKVNNTSFNTSSLNITNHVNVSVYDLGVDYGINVTSLEGNSSHPGNTTLSHTSVEEFWQYNALRISDGLEMIGQVHWHMALCLMGAYFIVGACLIKGVHSVGKVVYVTATLPYVLLTILFVRGLTLDGAYEGIMFYLKPDFSKLLEVSVWIEAAGQVFYSLGPAWGGIITMASYNKFHGNCVRDSILLACISEGTSLYAGFIVFAVMGYMAKQSSIPVSEIITAGPGLGFVAYPESLSTLPLPQMWAFLFFLMLITVGLDSEFTTFETFLTSLFDAWPYVLKKRRISVTIAATIAFFLLALPNATSGGIYIFQLLDWYTAPFGLMVIGTLECVVIAWIYGADRFGDDIEMMTGRRPPVLLKIMWCFVTPFVLLVTLVFTILQYKPPRYGKYTYPDWAQAIGWTLSLISIIPIPVYVIKELCSKQGSLKERLKASLKPNEHWGPAPQKYKELYQSKLHKRRVFSIKDNCTRCGGD